VHVEVNTGDYGISEYLPVEPNWVRTTPSPVNETVVEDETQAVTFGNLCLGTGDNTPRTKGFWTNKNGQALYGVDDNNAMRALNLRNANGTAYDPPLSPPATLKAAYDSFKAWLGSANATNMAYMLSAQLAAMKLNTLNGLVNPASLVYAPGLLPFDAVNDIPGLNALGFISVADLITAANADLGLHGNTTTGSFRAYQEALKNVIDAANQDNSTVFVQPTACVYTFETVALTDGAPVTTKKHRGHHRHHRRR
jgi:hypothetical protein